MGRTADFDLKTKQELERRVNSRCSNPYCRRATSGPKITEKGVINIGKAAHISAASKGGARFDPLMTDEERKSISNGIWLCSVCHDLVDADEQRYPAELLREWKKSAELRAERRLLIPFQRRAANESKEKARNRAKNTRIVCISIIVVLIVICLCVVGVRDMDVRTQYREWMEQGHFDFQNHDFLDAAECFHNASNVSFNDRTELEALYNQAMCYMLHGIYTPDALDQYCHSALNIYLKIIQQFDESDSDFYIDAMIDCGSVYYCLGYSTTDPNWSRIVHWVEETYDPQTMEGMMDLPVALSVKLALCCAQYYDIASQDEFRMGVISEAYEKALQYYRNTFSLAVLQNESVGQDGFDGVEVIGFLKEYVNRLLNIYGVDRILSDTFNQDETIDKMVEATAWCIEAIDSGFVTKGSYDYIELQSLIGKTMVLMAMIDPDLYGFNFEQAYDTLMPLVSMQLSPYYTQSYFTDCALYIVMTGRYTQEDLDNIARLFELAFDVQRVSGNTDALISLMVSACATGETVIRFGSPSDDYLAFLQNTARELEASWSNYLTEQSRESIEIIQSTIQ